MRTPNGATLGGVSGVRTPGRKPRLTAAQKNEIVKAVSSGRKTAADMARVFAVHPSTVSRLIAKARAGG
ncbi:MAG: helix-turn-helix domain-containing protein [Desulfovibrionaceae bacterium]